MSDSHEHTAGGQGWHIRLVQALDSDPMFHPAKLTYSVESDQDGFEISVVFAPIYYHLSSVRERLGLADTAVSLVRKALDTGTRKSSEVRVSSDGVALVDGAPIATLFRLTKAAPAPKKAAHHA